MISYTPEYRLQNNPPGIVIPKGGKDTMQARRASAWRQYDALQSRQVTATLQPPSTSRAGLIVAGAILIGGLTFVLTRRR
jgi:hypothetical protein